MRVASRELRNDTAGVLRRVANGEALEITVKGEAVAELGPLSRRRSGWTPKSVLMERLSAAQADPALQAELEALAGDTGELGSIE